jgi:16S rRNA (cytidine1402-2'-O)-methyltransferase
MSPFTPGLYVVATPIGNLGDLSERAAAVLAQASVVAAEDTRVSGRLVREAGGAGRLVSLTEHNVMERAPELLRAAAETVVALVSDAGTPAVSDPGARLVEAAHARGVRVFAIPGPSALAAAVSVSGFDGADIHFIGFLPKQKSERLARLRAVSARTIVLFEAPGRLSDTLKELTGALGDPEVVVCRELTKLHEEVVRGRASELVERFEGARGEVTLVVRNERQRPPADERDLTEYMAEMQRAGARRSSAAAEAARRFSVPRTAAYALWEEGGAEPG